MPIYVNHGHGCPKCKNGAISRLMDYKRSRYGDDYDLDADEYDLHKCTNEDCGFCDYPDAFYVLEIEIKDEFCPSCNSQNLTCVDWFDGEATIKCNDCNKKFEIRDYS